MMDHEVVVTQFLRWISGSDFSEGRNFIPVMELKELLEWECGRFDKLVELMSEDPLKKDCRLNMISSRVCGRGTPSCENPEHYD